MIDDNIISTIDIAIGEITLDHHFLDEVVILDNSI